MTIKEFSKPGKSPVLWNSQILKRYKKNNMKGNLHRAFQMASGFDAEVSNIAKKY